MNDRSRFTLSSYFGQVERMCAEDCGIADTADRE